MTAGRKIAVIVTARPSYGRVRSVLRALEADPRAELSLILSGSSLIDRYGNISPLLERDGLFAKTRIFNLVEGETLATQAKTTGLGLMELANVFEHLKPDVVVTIADRFETIATSIAAAYMNIPLAHLQGGEVTGNIDEKVRHANTKLADIHLVCTMLARERVLKMGERESAVFVTGCPSIDVAADVLAKPELEGDIFSKYGGVGAQFSLKEPFLIILQHPVTTEFGYARDQIENSLQAIDRSKMPAIWFWPNVDAGSDGTSKGIRRYREMGGASKVHFFRNMPPDDFLRLCLKSACVVGNSSVAIRECSFLGVPAVNIGSRQFGRERGANVMDSSYKSEDILTAIHAQIARPRPERDTLYGDGASGPRISEILITASLTSNKHLAY